MPRTGTRLQASRVLTLLLFQAALLTAPFPTLAASAAAKLTTIEGIRIHPSPEKTRVVFDLTNPTEHKLFALESPRRLVVDIKQTKLKAKLKSLNLKDTPIKAIRTSAKAKDSLRVVFDLTEAVRPRSFELKPIEQYGDRLVIDLHPITQQTSTVQIIQNAELIAQQKRDVIVAIDAGHGGDDPGAIGPGNLKEKTVVLQMAKKLHKLFEKERGFSSLLIRKSDYYVSLRKRSE
ncbi:MAG: AMIN domain-containing protein, partial [Pseudomonadales bacterium]